jgi:hypothetical protein
MDSGRPADHKPGGGPISASTSWPNAERTCRSRVSKFNERNIRREDTRTPDLYRKLPRPRLAC